MTTMERVLAELQPYRAAGLQEVYDGLRAIADAYKRLAGRAA